MKIQTTITKDEYGIEFEWLLTGYFSDYVPAKVSGPPEDCYPEEGGELETWACELLPNKYVPSKSIIPTDDEIVNRLYLAHKGQRHG